MRAANQSGLIAWAGAWLAVACLAWGAEVADAALGEVSAWAPARLGAWMLPSGLALAVWIPFARAKAWPRPLTDVLLFAAGAAVAPLSWSLALLMRGGEAIANARFLGGMSAARYALHVTQVAAAFGVLGGVLYWLFAGRPRPPYRDAR